MTPEQRQLARRALGLPNSNKRSYRNRFYAGALDHPHWMRMAKKGEARYRKMQSHYIFFYLTRKGAELALDKGEKLCPEDFPNV